MDLMFEKEGIEKRSSERHQIDRQIKVYTSSGEFLESAVLRDISGTGLCFMSKAPELYAIEQEVLLHINMPGTDKFDATMECRAKVVRLQPSAQDGGEPWVQVGILMSGLLSFVQHMQAADDPAGNV